MSARIFAIAALVASVPGCQEGEFVDYPELGGECPATRVQADGACCPAWAFAEATRCSLRPWTGGGTADAFGPTGARDPELSVDGAGRGVLAWEVAGDQASVLVVAEETAVGHLGLRDPALALDGDAVTPAIAAHEDGRAAIVWKQQEGGEGRVFASLRADTGGWRDPATTDALSWAGNAYEPRVAFGPGAEVLLVWNQWTGRNFRVVVSRRQGDDVDAPEIVSPPINFANGPRLAVADNGDAIVTWYQAGSTGELMVFASERLRTTGTWTRPGASDFLSPPGAPVASHPESNPVPAIDRRGGVAIAWTQEIGTGGVPVFLATRDGLGEWTTPESLTDSLSDPAVVARAPQIAIGPGGELWIVWTEEVGEAHRVVAVVRDSTGEWIEDGRDPAVLSSPGADAIEPALAVGPAGEAAVVFAEESGAVRRIVARRRHAGGTRWLDPEVLSDDAAGDASEPTVAIGASGRALAAWVQGPTLAGQVRIAWVD